MTAYSSLVEAIGHTPMVEVKRFNPNPRVRMLVKLEGFNPTGSVKDRVARYLIEGLERDGRLGPDSVILEPSSGNTGHLTGHDLPGSRLFADRRDARQRHQRAAPAARDVRRHDRRFPGRAGFQRRRRLGAEDGGRRSALRHARPVRQPQQSRWRITRRPAPEILADCPEFRCSWRVWARAAR